MRLRLSNEVVDVINEFGPKLFDDFDRVCFRFFVAVPLRFTSRTVPHFGTGERTPFHRPGGLATEEQRGTSGCTRKFTYPSHGEYAYLYHYRMMVQYSKCPADVD